MYWLRNYHRHRMKVGVYSHHHQSVYIFHNMVDNTPTANIENFITTWKNFLLCLVCFGRTVLIKQKFKEKLKKSPLSYLASKFNTWKERIIKDLWVSYLFASLFSFEENPGVSTPENITPRHWPIVSSSMRHTQCLVFMIITISTQTT